MEQEINRQMVVIKCITAGFQLQIRVMLLLL